MKRFICLALALLMLVPMLVACSNTKEPDDPAAQTTTEPSQSSPDTTVSGAEETTEPERETLDIPDVRYDGYEFVVANTFSTQTKYTTNALRADEQTGEPINDALYNRTSVIEERFGIKFVDFGISIGSLRTTLAAGEDAYAVTTADLSNVMSVVNAGYAVDLYSVDGIDLAKPWWDHNAEQKLSFNGHLYYTFSDFLITALDNARATYFNKDLVTNLSLENPYELVKSGKWTYMKMFEMAKCAVSNLNGDDVIDISDRVGIVDNATTFYEALLTGCNAEIIKQGSDGIPYFFCFDEKETFVQVYSDLLSTFTSDNAYLITTANDGRNMFIRGDALFTIDTLYMASKSRHEDINFGILPVPKYDEAQENYLHVSPNPHALMVPSTTKNVERTGIILEALSYYSSSSYSDDALIPAYFDTALRYKSTTDNESAEMLDIIHDNISYVIKIVGTTFSDQIYAYFAGEKTDVSSLLKKMEASQRKQLASTIENMK